MICIPLSEAGKSSLHYKGATLWNNLPTTTKTQITFTGFKESLRTLQTPLALILMTELYSFYYEYER